MNKAILYVVLAAIVISATAFTITRYSAAPAPATQPPSVGTTNIPTIVKAVMSRSIDAKGNATGVATTFSTKTDKIVYAVLTLKTVPKSTKLSYVRYLNNKYVDSKVAVTTEDNAAAFYFSFEKGIGDYPTGIYTLKFYINGRYSQSVTYNFQ